MRKILVGLAAIFLFFGLPSAAQAIVISKMHCTNNNLLFVSRYDSVTRVFSVQYIGLCYGGPFTVRMNVNNFNLQSEPDIPPRLNRYELATYRTLTLTGLVPGCPWVEASPRFRAEIARYRVRGSISVSLSQLPPSIAQALAEQLPVTEQH